MSSYFGGNSVYYQNVVKMRWAIGGLVVIILALATTIAFLSGNSPTQNNSPTVISEATATLLPPEETTELLVTRQRIESGTELEDWMFERKVVAKDENNKNVFSSAEIDYLLNQYTTEMIPAGSFVSLDSVTNINPRNPLEIPPGFRAATIKINAENSVDGFARPNTRVDVLWLYEDKKEKTMKIATLLRFVRVLSVGGTTEQVEVIPSEDYQSTATLLVTSRQAKVIELARHTGTLSLSLVGGQDNTATSSEETEIISFSDIVPEKKKKPIVPERPEINGHLLVNDPVTGEPVQFILSKESWEKNPEILKVDDISEKNLAARQARKDWAKRNLLEQTEKIKYLGQNVPNNHRARLADNPY